VSGLVHISQLANDYYHFEPTRKLLKGERTGEQFRLGDHVRVQVLRASLEERKIDFRLVPRPQPAPLPKAAAKAYDYSASGERYSLPKPAARTPGFFSRAAEAVGRAFGRGASTREQAAAIPAHAQAARGRSVGVTPDAIGRQAPAPGERSKTRPKAATKLASEALGRPATPAGAMAAARGGQAKGGQAKGGQGKTGKVKVGQSKGGQAKGGQAKGSRVRPEETAAGKRKATQPVAAKRSGGRRRRPKDHV
jgi:ribonuclease R